MALTPDKTRTENGVKVNEKIIPWGAVWTKDYGSYKKGDKYKADRLLSGGTGKVQGVTIHNTDGGANSETYTRATYPNQNMKDARVHYYVDDVEAWQNLKENEVGWHAGDGRGNGNETTVSIEIIMKGAAIKDDAKSEDNGARLAAAILARHGLTVDQLYTHNHWMGLTDNIVSGARKNCPLYILPRWAAFKEKVRAYWAQLQGATTPPTPEPEPPATPPTEKAYYRVRKTWADSKTQIGAFAVYENAKKAADDNKEAGYKVFDDAGAVVYDPAASPSPSPTPTPEPEPPAVDKAIWDFLAGKGLNAFAVAGIMGNLYAESGLKAANLQNSFEKSLGMTDEGYTAAVDNGTYADFINDNAGYGLAQWTFWSRKQALFEFAKAAGASIGSLSMQLDFLWKELQGYTAVLAVLKAAKSVLEASNVVLMQYEKPADQSEAVQEKRAGFGKTYYDKFAVQTPASEPEPPATPETPAPTLDNTPHEWEKKAVEMAISRGIITGDTTGNLRLHDPATRADVLVFLERAGVL